MSNWCICESLAAGHETFRELDNGATLVLAREENGDAYINLESPATGYEVWGGPIRHCPMCGKEL